MLRCFSHTSCSPSCSSRWVQLMWICEMAAYLDRLVHRVIPTKHTAQGIPTVIGLWQGAMRPWNEGGLYLRQLQRWHLRPFLWRANYIEVKYTTKGNFRRTRTWTTIPFKNSSESYLWVVWLIIHGVKWVNLVLLIARFKTYNRSFSGCFVQRLHEYRMRVKFQGE